MQARTRPLPPTLLLLVLAAWCGGCSHAVEAEFEPGTPREAVVQFNNALGDLDKERARSWVMEGDLQTEFFEVQFGMSQMISRFKQRFIEVYGADKLVLLQSPPGAQLDFMDTHADVERLNGMIVEPRGDLAEVRFANGDMLFVLREHGQWRVDAIGTNDPSKLDFIRASLGPSMMLARILDDVTPMIGTDDMSAEDFDLRLGRYIENAMRSLQQQAAQAVDVPSFGGAGANDQGSGAAGQVPPAADAKPAPRPDGKGSDAP